MRDANEVAERVAGAISDGERVNWSSVEAAGEPDLLRGLRLVDSIATAHRSVRASSAEGEAERLDQTVRTPPEVKATRRWGGLELLEKLGEGGFGEVWRAWDVQLQREVALKLRRSQASRAGDSGRRFIEEARQLAKVRHPNVVVVFGADEHDGREGIWTELVRGKDLDRCLAEQGPFSAHEATNIGVVLCQALAAVHSAGLIHRDVKTSNVMRETGGKILLMDFGSVGDLPREGEGEGQRGISGTPLAMAPEALQGEPLDRTVDIYALGVLLFQLTSGRFPVEAETWSALREKHRRGERVHLRDLRPDLPAQFIQVVDKAISPRREDRYATAGAMETALSAASGVVATGTAADGVRTSAAPLPAARRTRRGHWAAVAAAVGLVSVAILVTRWPGADEAPDETASEVGGRVAALPAPSLQTPPGSGSAPASFTAEAAIFREGRDGEGGDIRLGNGGRVQPGDHLFLEVEGTSDMHVYVLNEDETGKSYLLFPLSGFDTANPLSGGATHRLPGRAEGVEKSWVVTSAGGKERFLVVAAREPVAALENEIDRYTEATPGRAIEIPSATVRRLRGVGGIDTAASPGASPSGGLAALAEGVAGAGGSAVGIQVRLFELVNPAAQPAGS